MRRTRRDWITDPVLLFSFQDARLAPFLLRGCRGSLRLINYLYLGYSIIQNNLFVNSFIFLFNIFSLKSFQFTKTIKAYFRQHIRKNSRKTDENRLFKHEKPGIKAKRQKRQKVAETTDFSVTVWIISEKRFFYEISFARSFHFSHKDGKIRPHKTLFKRFFRHGSIQYAFLQE